MNNLYKINKIKLISDYLQNKKIAQQISKSSNLTV